VFSHLQGVYAPKMLPFYDLTISKVFPCPEHISLNDVLWKLWSLALKISFAEITLLLACDKIEPIFFSYSLAKARDASLKMLSMTTSLP
jgi:hypothetical protein